MTEAVQHPVNTRAFHMAKARNVARYGGRKDPIQRTPQALFDQLDAEFHFTIDAAASDQNAKCSRYFTVDNDGLLASWAGETVWCNPPFGRAIRDQREDLANQSNKRGDANPEAARSANAEER